MDLSPLIFVALAIAWAVYLVPQALKHHDEVVRSRSVDRFSHTMRVLARREPVSRTSSRLVVAPGRVPSAPVVTTKASSAPTPEAPVLPTAVAPVAPATAVPAVPPAVRREAARRAARRRRRVLLSLVVVLAVVLALAAAHVLVWASVAAPAALLVAWLVACRLMVRREQAAPLVRTVAVETEVQVALEADDTSSIPVVVVDVAEHVEVAEPAHVPSPRDPAPAAVEPGLWEPLPVTLPTYVSKPAAERRSVRTIDLDATGVWTSGRTESDAALVREAEQRARVEDDAPGRDRAVGS